MPAPARSWKIQAYDPATGNLLTEWGIPTTVSNFGEDSLEPLLVCAMESRVGYGEELFAQYAVPAGNIRPILAFNLLGIEQRRLLLNGGMAWGATLNLVNPAGSAYLTEATPTYGPLIPGMINPTNGAVVSTFNTGSSALFYATGNGHIYVYSTFSGPTVTIYTTAGAVVSTTAFTLAYGYEVRGLSYLAPTHFALLTAHDVSGNPVYTIQTRLVSTGAIVNEWTVPEACLFWLFSDATPYLYTIGDATFGGPQNILQYTSTGTLQRTITLPSTTTPHHLTVQPSTGALWVLVSYVPPEVGGNSLAVTESGIDGQRHIVYTSSYENAYHLAENAVDTTPQGTPANIGAGVAASAIMQDDGKLVAKLLDSTTGTVSTVTSVKNGEDW